jgi:hypothetical protein
MVEVGKRSTMSDSSSSAFLPISTAQTPFELRAAKTLPSVHFEVP